MSRQVTLGFYVWKMTGSSMMNGLEGSKTSGREIKCQN